MKERGIWWLASNLVSSFVEPKTWRISSEVPGPTVPFRPAKAVRTPRYLKLSWAEMRASDAPSYWMSSVGRSSRVL